MARAEALEQEIFACQETVADETAVAGPVVITVTEALATYFVLRHLSALRAAYPALRVELRRTERTLNLSMREADIALRLASVQSAYSVPKMRSPASPRPGRM